MRGPLFRQPHVTNTHVFAFNGELYSEPNFDKLMENDAAHFFDKAAAMESTKDLASWLQTLQGPFSFVLFNVKTHTVYFARDIFGRRSLTLSVSKHSFILSSVAAHSLCIEVPPGVVFAWNLKRRHVDIVPMRPFVESLSIFCAQLFHTFSIDYALAQRTLPLFTLCPGLRPLSGGSMQDLKRELDPEIAIFRKCMMNAVHLRSCEGSRRFPVAVLFSGGVDSLLLAALLHLSLLDQYLGKDEEVAIDLLNVAFVTSEKSSLKIPDRSTGLQAWAELRHIFPKRTWNFVCIDVRADEAQVVKLERLSHLLRPGGSVMDESLGMALWFAARGNGYLQPLNSGGKEEPYTSPAKVLLSGIGPDELLGGYARHRTRFERSGWTGILRELEMDIRRIGDRNFARDDRIVADHGKEIRMPFFDETVVEYLNSLPINVKTNFELPKGEGEKMLLRLLLLDLGFLKAASAPKRAMQFGSNSAKIFA